MIYGKIEKNVFMYIIEYRISILIWATSTYQKTHSLSKTNFQLYNILLSFENKYVYGETYVKYFI